MSEAHDALRIRQDTLLSCLVPTITVGYRHNDTYELKVRVPIAMSQVHDPLHLLFIGDSTIDHNQSIPELFLVKNRYYKR